MSSCQQVALDLIKFWEGCRLNAYPDPATGGDPWTIGYGATGHLIKKGTVWTQEEADADLLNRINNLTSKIREHLEREATDCQLGAMISLAYNIGIGNFLSSTLLKKFNAGEIASAANEFLRWDHAGGKVMQGLLNRREEERHVFLNLR